MPHPAAPRTICWSPLWNKAHEGVGLEHLLLADGSAHSVLLAVDEAQGPFRLDYQLTWDAAWQLRTADLTATIGATTKSLQLRTAGDGRWTDGAGQTLAHLAGCRDIDIWPTPFTNSFPLLREPLAIGERRQFWMAWVAAPDLTVQAQPQAYTRLAEGLYLFENLDGSGFKAQLPVDAQGIVLDYPDLFRRVRGAP